MRLSRIGAFLALAFAIAAAQSPGACCPEKPERAKQKLLWQKMERDVMKVADDLNGVMSVSILDLTSGEQMLIRADEVMPQASSIKITVLLELYKQVQEGKLKLSDEYTIRKEDLVQDSDLLEFAGVGKKLTLRDLAAMVVAVSDNGATNVLIDRVGMENVNATLHSFGLRSTMLRRKMMDVKAASEGRENVATAREMTELLRQIYAGKVLNPEMTADLWKLLAISKDSKIPRELPDSVMVANKPGELEAVRTDSGVVFVPNRPFVISVMTTFLKDEKDGDHAISRIAKIAYDYFDRVSRASEYGRVVSTKN